MKLDRPIVIWTGVVVMTTIATFQFLTAKRAVAVTMPLPLNSPPTDARQKKDTYKVTRPVRETRKKVVEYNVTRPVWEQRTRTVLYTQMTLVRGQHTKTDPETGEVKRYAVAKFVPEHREKAINYTVCNMVSEKKSKTVEYQVVRMETIEKPWQ